MSIGATSILDKALKATAAMSTNYVICKFGADDDTLAVSTVGTEKPIGISQETITTTQITAGNKVLIRLEGTSKLKIVDTVTRGDLLMASTGGAGIPATSGKYYIAEALRSGVTGDVIMVKLCSGVV